MLSSKRAERIAETLLDAAEGLSGDTVEQLKRFVDAAALDETYQELLACTLTIAQDTAVRGKRRALGRALASALDDFGTKVDDEIAFVASSSSAMRHTVLRRYPAYSGCEAAQSAVFFTSNLLAL